MTEPLWLFLDETGDGLPQAYFDDGIDGLEEQSNFETRGIGGQGFGASGFGSGSQTEVVVSRIVGPDNHQGVDYRRVRNGLSDWSADIPGQFDLHEWVESDVHIVDDEAVRFRGKVWRFDHQDSENTVTLEGPGHGGELERAGATHTVRFKRAWLAFDNYIRDRVSGWTLTTRLPDIEVIAENELIQSVDSVRDELESATDITSTDPFQIRDGGIEPAQTCFTMDGTDTHRRTIQRDEGETAGLVEYEELSQGTAIRLVDEGDRLEYTFEPDYQIPQARIAIRIVGAFGPEVKVGIDEIDDDALTLVNRGEDTAPEWRDLRQFGEHLRNLSGQTTVVVEATSPSDGGFVDIDVVAPYDVRHKPTLNDQGITLDGATYLDGPELYPRRAQLVTNRVETDHNISEGSVTAFFSDTGREQAIELSTTGELWSGLTNSLFAVESFSAGGYGISIRFTFSWDDEDGDVLATPRRGRIPQRLTGWRLRVTMNDLAVIEELELTGSHMENIQELADRAGLRFYIDPDERVVHSFHRGQELEDLALYDPEVDAVGNPTGVYNEGIYNEGWYGGGEAPHPGFQFEDIQSTKATGKGYANVVRVLGQRQDDGTRVKGVARDELEIAELSKWGKEGESEHVHTDATITSRTDAKAKAEELLTEMVSQREFDGSVEGLPRKVLDHQPIHPGIEYYVGKWDMHSTLEEVHVTDHGVSLDFRVDKDDRVLVELKEAKERSDSAHDAI